MFSNLDVISNDKSVLHFISIENYSAELIERICAEVGKIWNGDLDGEDDLDLIKAELRELFDGKSDKQKHGLVSEFICHLYLRSSGYEQHFLFRNLEEKGMKKGFDGLYILDDYYWLYESKSTLPTTAGASHNANISEAYNDLKKKVEGTYDETKKNNPWKNAYSHAANRAIKENATLSQTLKSFSSDYTLGKYYNISNFNVIPSSTIYMDAGWTAIDSDDLGEKILGLIDRYTCRQIAVICLNKKTVDDFITFING
ncbi:hypothetical protein ATE47_01515 [Chryseobacterium sp. IHB B 17019]|uniref:hypothetical protein n=1 Tax=Chryseobacterium sp. IHB B 17019 TaxID=1721091 RepID=UPI000722722E|nr:hypothetical protein [Chryseobacterium sp. IHB B 17019]ALR29289.1 hypothetical protein ATE47_01515 [Chryseobacterium sp. IHB B 17019]